MGSGSRFSLEIQSPPAGPGGIGTPGEFPCLFDARPGQAQTPGPARRRPSARGGRHISLPALQASGSPPTSRPIPRPSSPTIAWAAARACGDSSAATSSDEDKVDFGASDAALQDNDIAQVPDGVVMLPVTAGGVALAYNLPDVPQDLKLSRRAYAGIFLGEIKNWNDPLIAAANPGVKLPETHHRDGGAAGRQRHHFRLHQTPRRHQRKVAEPIRPVHAGGLARKRHAGERQRRRGRTSPPFGGRLGLCRVRIRHQYGLQIALLENKAGKFVAAQ